MLIHTFCQRAHCRANIHRGRVGASYDVNFAFAVIGHFLINLFSVIHFKFCPFLSEKEDKFGPNFDNFFFGFFVVARVPHDALNVPRVLVCTGAQPFGS